MIVQSIIVRVNELVSEKARFDYKIRFSKTINFSFWQRYYCSSIHSRTGCCIKVSSPKEGLIVSGKDKIRIQGKDASTSTGILEIT
jgi:hypothetical protein